MFLEPRHPGAGTLPTEPGAALSLMIPAYQRQVAKTRWVGVWSEGLDGELRGPARSWGSGLNSDKSKRALGTFPQERDNRGPCSHHLCHPHPPTQGQGVSPLLNHLLTGAAYTRGASSGGLGDQLQAEHGPVNQ